MENLITLECEFCHNTYSLTKNDNDSSIRKLVKHRYCSRKCKGLHNRKRITLSCENCNKSVIRRPFEIKAHTFCSSSCAATYNNTHKTKGVRRSKLESYLETSLKSLFKLDFVFNDVETFKTELDIYIPSLKLAFELNGIFHYEPIYGENKLSKIKSNDDRKFQICLENSVELCIIDTSQQKYFKESTSKKYLDIISNIIQKKLTESQGIEP